MADFLPINQAEVQARGWEQVDFVCVTGDSYVDHPSFGMAIISRVLEDRGYRVAMLAQPDVHTQKDFTRFGRPKYGFLVNSGNIDSMVAHYTAAKRKRSEDAYTAGNKAGKRPDRAVMVYTQKIKEIYHDIPVVIGGLEASLRRFAHYDYWDDAVRPSILADSGADILIYGMGEKQIVEIADGLAAGKTCTELRDIRGICYMAQPYELPTEHISCASFSKVSENKESYAKACKIQMEWQDSVYGKHIVQKHGDKILVQTPPMPALTQEELDKVFSLPFMRSYHPSYEKEGGVASIEEVEFSIMHNRGCFGHCNFCSIAFHQGRQVTCRSEESVLREAKSFVGNPRFKGYIHDVGGPTANFRHPSCKKQLTQGLCSGRKCLAPTPCPAMEVDHEEYIRLLRQIREIPGIKKVFIRSGIRFDYVMADKNPAFLRELIEHHVSGQLKVAPEHCSNHVLDCMGKPHIETYERFAKSFYQITKRLGKEQYLVPYLISSHPGSTLRDAVTLAVFLKKNRIRPEQVQDFYPTPGTVSTCMFYTGINPLNMEPVFVPKTPEEKQMQRALLQYYKPENRALIIKALLKAGRADLIGTSPDCLVTPDRKFMAQKAQVGKEAPRSTQKSYKPNGKQGGSYGSKKKK